MANAWLSHVKKTMTTMKSKGKYKKGDGLKKVINEAKKTYKKSRRGGGEDDKVAFAPMKVRRGGEEGGRRRTRRHSRR